MEGVTRTTSGYAGGEAADPTYRNLGDHTEAVEVIFDPSVISYEELLTVFWESHYPVEQTVMRQYRNALFHTTDEQKKAVWKSVVALEERYGNRIRTDVERLGEFYEAEDYHQKYTLRRHSDVYARMASVLGSERELNLSAVGARLNGYLGGFRKPADFGASLDALDLEPELKEWLREAVTPLLR